MVRITEPSRFHPNRFYAQQYCIELTPSGNHGNEVYVFQNDKIVDEIPEFSRFDLPHRTCFEYFDLANDIFELRHSGGNDGVSMTVNLLLNGFITKLHFGLEADLPSIFLDSNDLKCKKQIEATRFIKIQNNKIIRSECFGSLFKYTGCTQFKLTKMVLHIGDIALKK